LEVEEAPIERCLMLAQRLARLTRDEDAQTWLGFEQCGYPPKVKADDLGACAKYAYRFDAKNVLAYTTSLPHLEANKRAAEVLLNKTQPPSITGTAENFTVARATKEVMGAAAQLLAAARDGFVTVSSSYATLRAGLHRWVADTLIALELGNIVEPIFEAARVQVDAFVRAHVPKAAEQLLSVNERMRERNSESLSQSLTSCRRLLLSTADAVFPARPEQYVDAKGKKRDVGVDDYKNRLLAFLDGKIASRSTSAIIGSQLEHLAARLDALYGKASKGVHDDVSEEEARLVVIQTYLFLAEVARYARDLPTEPASAPSSQSATGKE
jgi:hypothetical protein